MSTELNGPEMAVSSMSISENTYASLHAPDINLYSTLNVTSHNSSGETGTGKSPQYLRLAAVGLGLLCAILLTATIAMGTLYRRERGLKKINTCNCTWEDVLHKRDNNSQKNPQEKTCYTLRIQLQHVSNQNKRLQRDYDSLSNERDQLQRDYHRISNERDQLQRNYDNVSNERDQLQRNCKSQCVFICPEGWKKFSSQCYYFSTQRVGWEGSRSNCHAKGADLVIINSQEEQEFINQNANGGHHWIGLKDSAARTFEWVDKTPLQQTFWKDGSPDENRRTLAHCVLTGPGEELWVDTQCYHKWMSVCETDAVCI